MSVGPQFARPVALYQKAWAIVAARTGLPDATRDLWIELHREGDPRRERQAMLRHLAGVRWRWPWFAAWRREFARGGAWPCMWESYGFPDRQAEARIALLGHSVGSVVALLDRLRDFRRLAEERGGYRLSVVPGCPVEADVASRHAADIEVGNLSVVPPFFPGDRTMLMVKSAT